VAAHMRKSIQPQIRKTHFDSPFVGKRDATTQMLDGAPNNACTRLGVGPAFFERFRGLRLVPPKWRYLLPPQAGNANRWVATVR
jgi:hypothetical protein